MCSSQKYRKTVSNEIGSTKTVKNFRIVEKQHLIFKNSRKNVRIWAILAAPVVAYSGDDDDDDDEDDDADEDDADEDDDEDDDDDGDDDDDDDDGDDDEDDDDGDDDDDGEEGVRKERRRA